MDAGVGRRHAAKLALDEEEAVLIARARVGYEARLDGIECLDVILDVLEENRLPVAHNLRDAEAMQREGAGAGSICFAHQPFRIADYDTGARGKNIVHGS